MKRQLEYFMIDGAVGGNQEWFRNVVMYMGGCAAATACDCCIYFARQGEEHLYPYDIQNLTKEDYIQFGMKMKPYIRPRVGGVKKLSMFIEGFSRYLADRGEKCLAMRGFDGSEDFVWHWFLCYGYEETEHSFRIDVATYGESAVLDLADLWNTGCEEKGGLILFERRDQKE